MSLSRAYVSFVTRYWLDALPRARAQMRRWRALAEVIPDPTLRSLALQAHSAKAANVEGAAAFATLAPRRHRAHVIRAQVAFQTMYDYLDTLSEQPGTNPSENARRLHMALVDGLAPRSNPPADFYAFNQQREDGGYLHFLASACRQALAALPSSGQALTSAQALAQHIVDYQALGASPEDSERARLREWALGERPPAAELRWWEMAASGGSSLGICALIAAAAKEDLTPVAAREIHDAYWPWTESLHTLLDAVADEDEDEARGQRSILADYASPAEAACRLRDIAHESISRLRALPDGPAHEVLLAAMVAFYVYPASSRPVGRRVRAPLLEALGSLERPVRLIFATRAAVARVRASSAGTRSRWKLAESAADIATSARGVSRA